MFAWTENGLLHTSRAGVETVVGFGDVAEYVAALPMQEKQAPIPALPAFLRPESVAADPDVIAAAQSRPDAMTAAMTEAIGQVQAAAMGLRAATEELRAIVDRLSPVQTATPAAPAAPSGAEAPGA